MHKSNDSVFVPPYTIHFPQTADLMDQDSEYCELEVGGQRQRLRLHDYHEIYNRPGLYEHLFYERLKCTSPAVVAGLLSGSLAEREVDASSLRAIDVGAGNGMVGQELRNIGVRTVVGVDIIRQARAAALRDRPGVYHDYLVADLTALSPEQEAALRAIKPNLLVTVAALGFGDIPPEAFATAFNLIADDGWIAFNIRDRFLSRREGTPFSRLIDRMMRDETLVIDSWKRYVHRINVRGEPIEYVALVARRHGDITPSMLADAHRGEKIDMPATIEQQAAPAALPAGVATPKSARKATVHA